MRQTSFLFALLAAVGLLLGTQTAQAQGDPVQVFILAGQSNMVGHGKVEFGLNPLYDGTNTREVLGGIGSLRAMVTDNPGTFGHGGTTPLVDSNGDFLVRSDVNVYGLRDGNVVTGNLSTGMGRAGSPWVGPEYGFGHSVGNALNQDVLIIKVATGGTTLAGNWRSPSAVTNRGGSTGDMWTTMLATVNDVLNVNRDTLFPEYTGRSHQIAGFGWHQGFNDGLDTAQSNEYEANMADFIRDVQGVYGTDLPFVIANSGFGGWDQSGTNRLTVMNAQLNVANDGLYPEFAGEVETVETRGMWRDSTQSPSTLGHHWNHNGITHWEIGEGMGEAYIGLVPEPTSLGLISVGGLALLRRNR